MELYTYKATVLEIKDGDTLSVEISLGFDVSIKQTVRLLEFDAPETRKIRNVTDEQVKRGKEVKKWLEERLSGKGVIIKTRKSSGDEDVYGRYLAYVYIDENGEEVCLNHLMVELGYNKTQQESAESKK